MRAIALKSGRAELRRLDAQIEDFGRTGGLSILFVRRLIDEVAGGWSVGRSGKAGPRCRLAR